MKYEICPICSGKGIVDKENSFKKYRKCHICSGTGILNVLTGLPIKDKTNIQKIKKQLKLK